MKKLHFKINWLSITLSILVLFAIILILLLGLIGVKIFMEIGLEDSPTIKRLFLNRWDWLAFGVSFISLIFSSATAWSQWKTQKNTAKITPESQRELLKDYVRHFYMNLIVITAMRENMKGKYHTHYPAEEHFLKLKIDMSSLHPAIFFNNIEKYQKICHLQKLFGNFNEEVDVAIAHFTKQGLISEVKERDFDTLTFKMGLFTKKVMDLLSDFGANNAAKELCEKIEDDLKKRNSEKALAKADEYFKKNEHILANFPREMQDSLYQYSSKQKCLNKNTLEDEKNVVQERIKSALSEINRHIYVEMTGRNSSGSKKIFLIPF